MKPLFIGYWTIGTPYQNEAAQCLDTLDAFNLEHEFVGVPNRGQWVRNCAQKPEVIFRMMQKHDGRPLVYIDVDARVRKQPVLFDSISADTDIACHYRHGVELLSGTLYIGTTPRARQLVQDWCAGCDSQPGEWDQRVLERLIMDGNYKVLSLPPEYCRVFDDKKMGVAVIEHMQASRRLANKV